MAAARKRLCLAHLDHGVSRRLDRSANLPDLPAESGSLCIQQTDADLSFFIHVGQFACEHQIRFLSGSDSGRIQPGHSHDSPGVKITEFACCDSHDTACIS